MKIKENGENEKRKIQLIQFAAFADFIQNFLESRINISRHPVSH